MAQHSFKVDTRLALLLSENYRSPEKALKELVDNAWDAEATEVTIELPVPLSSTPIVVHDNGSGMTIYELQSEYLNIARNRRDRSGHYSPNLHRRVKGRKGIGKFAGLMITSSMKLETWARNRYSTFEFDKALLANYDGLPDMPLNIKESDSAEHSGTRITLSHLHQHIRFPTEHKLKQLLIAEYGRENDFKIIINDKPLDIDDLQGEYKEKNITLLSGSATLRCTISNQKRKLRKPGISIRIDGKVVGEPSFFGLDQSDDIPRKLLEKCFGEIELTDCSNDVTADWGALIEGSITEETLAEKVKPILLEQLKSVYGQEMHLAQARLRKKALDRISKLPENRREFADKAIKKILDRFYQEPEDKLEPVVNVLLDALERNDYRIVLEHINSARHSEISRFAEALEEFGLVEMALVAEQANNRLGFLDYLEEICLRPETLEKHVHKSIEGNLWLFGVEYSLFSSNITLKRQIEEYLGHKYKGDRADKRPDLFLSENLNGERLLIEFKRPSHNLVFEDYQQATGYRNDFQKNGIDQQINVIIIGGELGNNLPAQDRREPNVSIMKFSDLISAARRQYQWLLENRTIN
ncbi:DNA mismatch repair protein MutL [Marinomonas spartinae]|uniref:DNA mismatch repair protein MutL n=1 Tax=Marinomonas spartinae TaxID=1792290 RepID=A0A1A8T8D3_9GAMM|nr:ATP-binding protein [Marinomonas spartinae]SBS28923.1 DNA mismatch repair protein MutL [Marinomonas spartinae]